MGGRTLQAAICLDTGYKGLDRGQPRRVAALDRIAVGQHRERLGRLDEPGPVGVVHQAPAVGVVGHEHVNAPGRQLALAGCGQLNAHQRGLLEALGHDGLHERARLHPHQHARLVDVGPLLDDRIGFGGDAIDVAAHIGLGESQLLHALGQHPDGKHGHVAPVLVQVVNEGGKGRIHVLHLGLEVARQLGRQVDVDARQLLRARVAISYAVVVRPHTHAHHRLALDPVGHRPRQCAGGAQGQQHAGDGPCPRFQPLHHRHHHGESLDQSNHRTHSGLPLSGQ